MKQECCHIRSLREVAGNTFVLTFVSAHISTTIRAGQFVNIKVDDTTEPLLRRPYSVYHAEDDSVEIIFNIVGKGSAALRRKREGELLDVLGPLGVPFALDEGDFDTAILVGGGLGVAPLPLATRELGRLGKRIVTLLGARTANQVVDTHLENVHVATDDGTRGVHGTVVDLAKQWLSAPSLPKLKLFACGPTAMLRALGALAIERNIPCEVSLEGPMACGFGVCQGCPVELIGGERKYALMCKDGPTFDVRKIKL
jgi:dihydroorotate dehydrogenase electron transfer subunit